MTLVVYGVGLIVVIWVLAWGSLSVANVLGGLAVGRRAAVAHPRHVPRRTPPVRRSARRGLRFGWRTSCVQVVRVEPGAVASWCWPDGRASTPG